MSGSCAPDVAILTDVTEPTVSPEPHPLQALLGGPRGAIEGSLPPIVFVLTYLISGEQLGIGVAAALITGAVLAVLRLIRKERPVRVVGALLVVVVAAAFAYYTGSAVDYFWPLVLANIASALAFALSILIRWPLLGVIVGPLLGTGMTWRKDPDLLRAYSRATWIWVLLNVVRAAVQIPLIVGNDLLALAAIRIVFYALVIATIAASWAVIKRTLPDGHPGIRRPRIPSQAT